MTLKVIRLNEITNKVSVDRGEKNPQEILVVAVVMVLTGESRIRQKSSLSSFSPSSLQS